MFSLKLRNIGIDIGTYCTKIVYLNGRNYAYYKIETPNDAIYNGYLKNAKAIADLLKSNLNEKKIKGNLCFSVSSSDIIIREIRMPHMKESELKEAVKFEAQNYIPADLDDHIIGFKVIQTLNSDQDTSLRILFVASPQNLINDYVTLSQEINMPLKAIDIIPNCILKAVKFLNLKDNDSTALLDIGKTKSNIIISDKGLYAFHREIAFGGDNVTNYLAHIMDIDFDKAEDMKITGVFDENILGSVYDELLRDIDAVFNYYSTHSRNFVKKLYLIGGASLSKTLLNTIKNYFNIEAVILDTEKKDVLPALGAAIREG